MLKIRLETVIVLAVLLVLLLQLPRVDDPPDLRLVGDEISSVAAIRGAALYVDRGPNGVVLAYVYALGMHRDASGVAYVSKLDAQIPLSGGRFEWVRIDATAEATARGWQPVTTLDGLVLPGAGGTGHPVEFRRLRLRKAVCQGQDVLFLVGRVEGRDLVSRRVIAEDFDQDVACPAVPVLQPVSASGSGDGAIGPFWAWTGTVCWQGSRLPTSRASLVWTAGYRYD